MVGVAGCRRAEEDAYSFGAECFDAAAERLAAGQGGVDEGQDNDRDAEAGGLRKDAQSVGVADALGLTPCLQRMRGRRPDLADRR